MPCQSEQSANASQNARRIAFALTSESRVQRQPVRDDAPFGEAVMQKLEVLAGIEIDDAGDVRRRRFRGNQIEPLGSCLQEITAVLDMCTRHARIFERVIGRVRVDDVAHVEDVA